MPSTSPASMPASSRAALIAWHAIASSDSGSDLANLVWPIPAMAVRSLMVMSRTSLLTGLIEHTFDRSDRLGGMIDAEAAEVLETLPLERLEAEICTLSGHRNAAACRWLLLVAEF